MAPRRKRTATKERRRPATGVITALASSDRDPGLLRIVIDGEDAGTLLRAAAEALRLEVGKRVSATVATAIEEAVGVAAARTHALRLLGTRDRSHAMLIALLVERGHAEERARAAVKTLEQDGWVDDRRFAEARARSLGERRPLARAFLAAALEDEGVDAALAGRVTDAALPARSELERATALARATIERSARRAAKPERRTSETRRARLVAAALARAGFEADTIAAALRRCGLESDSTDDSTS